MTMQMYFIRPKDGVPPDANEQIAGFVAQRGGYVLMATASGSLIVGMDDQYFDGLKAHFLVGFVGPVSFNPEGKATLQLQRLFAANMARQMLARNPGHNQTK